MSFTVKTQWITSTGEYNETFQSEHCREIWIRSLSRRLVCDDSIDSLSMALFTSDVPMEGLQELCNVLQLRFVINTEEIFTHTLAYKLFDNKNTVLMGMYWLILLQRHRLYFNHSITKWLREIPYWEWDGWGDKTNSQREWKKNRNGDVLTTQQLLARRLGPIDYRRYYGRFV
jgi:hypothetical protein